MEPVRVGVVNYLNTVPLTAGLEKARGLQLVPAAPAHVAGLLGGPDETVRIGLVSLLGLVHSPTPLTVLPVGMIGCDGPTLTVRVFSRVPLGEITRLHADTDSTTSVILARLLLELDHGARPRLVPYDARERIVRTGHGPKDTTSSDGGGPSAAPEVNEWPEAMVLIGDKVVIDSPPAVRYPYQMDLGEAWKSRTGMPFVYAVWACRAGDENTDAVRAAAALLDRTRRRNTLRLDAIVNEHAVGHRWPTDLARRYLTRLLRYDLTEEAAAAAQEFIHLAASHGLTRPARLSIASRGATAAATADAGG